MTDLPPYARLLDLRIIDGADGPQVVMPFSNDVLGRPGFLHGGAIAGLLEFDQLAGADRLDAVEAKALQRMVDGAALGVEHAGLEGDEHAGFHAAGLPWWRSPPL